LNDRFHGRGCLRDHFLTYFAAQKNFIWRVLFVLSLILINFNFWLSHKRSKLLLNYYSGLLIKWQQIINLRLLTFFLFRRRLASSFYTR